MSKPAAPTPMMQQYFDIKDKHKDSILFYRLGDFYEMFFDDAKVASKELELTLTGRDWGQPERAPMCGVPYHSCEAYIARLIQKGYKVAICEQTEDPAQAKGLVRREVIRTITPGTVTDSSMLEENSNNYLAAVCMTENAGALCFCDISTGQFVGCRQSGPDFAEKIMRELGKIGPREVIFCGHAWTLTDLVDFASSKLSALCENENERFAPERAETRLKAQFGWYDIPSDIAERPEMIRAAGALLLYLDDTMSVGLSHIRKLEIWESAGYMELDLNARRNLELTVNLGGEKKGTLLSVIDMTCTSMGGRLIKSWLEKPLMNVPAIRRRQDGVRAFAEDPALIAELGSALSRVLDMERIITRVSCRSAGARDLRGLLQGIKELPAIRSLLIKAGGSTLPKIAEELDMLEDVGDVIEAAIVDEPPLLVKDGGVIRPGFSSELDGIRELLQGGAGRLASIEARERERTGIRTLKVGYNRVFGYYIEISRGLASQAPDDYIRKQTLANAERYITPELKELEGEILSAGERSKALEYDLFCQVRDRVADCLDRVQRTASAVAICDVLRSFADAAVKYGYTCPDVNELDLIEIHDGRHPVVERVLKDELFVPNDTYLNRGEHRVYVITGPNMAGKSTYMRQVALITILAQCGSFVPASSATIGITDRIFTRVGASDNLYSGLSTFMVEMTEVAEILRSATPRSLLILDEVGRGTSTFDGMSIARAVLEHIADKKTLGARTLFATHYHELCALEGEKPGIRNYNIVVKRKDDQIVFIKKIVPGGVSESYGIDVAKLAGLPEKVIRRAKAVLTETEKGRPKKTPVYKEEEQISMEGIAKAEVIEELKTIRPETLSPIEALNVLYNLCKKVQS